MRDDLGNRMKRYEDSFRFYLPIRMPLIVRIDGKGFHTFVKKIKADKPFDSKLNDVMYLTALALVRGIDGAQVAYLQSDEISILINNYSSLNSEPWFGNNLQKIASISAAIATAAFNKNSPWDETALFDARVFVLPKEEVVNYFVWRQQDAIRNSVQMLARSVMSHSECNGLNCEQLKEAVRTIHGIDWDSDIGENFKSGTFLTKAGYSDFVGRVIRLSEDRDSIEQYVYNKDTKGNKDPAYFKAKAEKCLSSLTEPVAWNKKFKNWMSWLGYFKNAC